MRFFFKRLHRWFFEKDEVNYLYFGIFLVILSAFSLFHFLVLEKPLLGIRLFFLLYAIGQAVFEVWAFIFIAYLLKRLTPRWVFFSFISFSFLVLLIHFTDFTLVRLMDASIFYLFKFLFGRGIEHIVTALLALNLNLWMGFLVILSLLLIPLAGLLLYELTGRLAKRKPWNIAPSQIVIALIATGGSLFALDVLAYPYLDRWMYHHLHNRLPFGATFLSPHPECIRLPHPISPPRDEQEMRNQLPLLSAKTRPNIYFFVIETLRRDFVNEDTAPCLSAFAKENIHFVSSYANANWTALSWFAIFQSHFPYDWAIVRDTWKEGSIPLQLLKQLGYKIRVYSSADLHYFDMDRVILGEKRQLADQVEEYSSNRALDPCDRDALCINTFKADLKAQDRREGNLFLFFFDGTHSEYSFPKDFPLKFEPIVKQIDYLTLTLKEIEPVKNRYRNAIAYCDSLMDQFFTILQAEGLYEESVVVITGDHGEEFYEEGSLFHGTHLNRYQTEVPIFCKFPGKAALFKEATHVDLFPSILHHLTGTADFGKLFDGRSIFSENRFPYRVAVLHNGMDTPMEFSIENTRNRLQVRFLSPRDIYNQTELEVISLQTEGLRDKSETDCLFEKLFPHAIDGL